MSKDFSGWSEAKLKELKAKGKIKNFHLPAKNCNKRNKNTGNHNKVSINRSKEKEWLSWNLGYFANQHSLELIEEYRFCERKFRFDYFFPAINCAIEYEGIFSAKSRHTNLMGYSKDTDKYREAAILKIIVLRYTAINYKSVLDDLLKILNK